MCLKDEFHDLGDKEEEEEEIMKEESFCLDLISSGKSDFDSRNNQVKQLKPPLSNVFMWLDNVVAFKLI